MKRFRDRQRISRMKKEIYSTIIVLGFLLYYYGQLKIANKKSMLKGLKEKIKIKKQYVMIQE